MSNELVPELHDIGKIVNNATLAQCGAKYQFIMAVAKSIDIAPHPMVRQ
jgi:hypothetical protein